MRLKYFLILLISFFSLQLFSQIEEMTFRKISPTSGFSYQAVKIIKQDLMGFIWMGTSDGIIRYDSKDIIRFTHQATNTNSLPSNLVSGIEIDKKNNIWVSTEEGLCFFNHQKEQFEPFSYTYEDGSEVNKRVFAIALDGTGDLWIADQYFVGYLDQEKKQLVRFSGRLDGGKSPRLLYTDDTNCIWLGTDDGTVYQILDEEKRLEKKIDGPGSFTRTILASNDKIWVGYEAHGARLYDLNGHLIKHYSSSTTAKFDFKTASVRKILKDAHGRIWIGSYLGLFLDTGSDLIHFDKKDYKGLPHNSIYDIYEDKHGGLWFSTWSGGVAYSHHADNKFITFRNSLLPNSLSSNMVSSFAQTTSDDLFVGTELGGVNKFDEKTKSFQKIDVLKNGSNLTVKSLCADDYGGLWVGTAFHGIYYKAEGKTEFEHFSLVPKNASPTTRVQVFSICKSDSGVWIGTSPVGLFFYSFKKKQIIQKTKENEILKLENIGVRYLTIDSNDNLWIATLKGLFRLHLPSDKITHFNTYSAENHKTKTSAFYFVNELSDGRIWLGTRANAIHIYDPKIDEISSFDAKGLLENTDVYGIYEQFTNSIWITTNKGLILCDQDKHLVRSFDIADGIQGNMFNPGAIFDDSENNLYCGGTNGFTQIRPNGIEFNSLKANTLITKVAVNNEKVIPFQSNKNKYSELVLNPGKTTLKFHFSADNYLLPEKNKFMCRLVNYFDEWVVENANGTATFINVPSGDFVFEVKACNNDGVWNDVPVKMSVKIKQFWYKSHVALALYSLTLIVILLGLLNFLREREKLKKIIFAEKVEHEHEDRLNEMKLRFFTNISHEFRTPLTLIDWPIKNLLKAENLTHEQQDQLNTVQRNSSRLLQLINQVLDIRKIDNDKEKLNVSKIELVDFVKERMLCFSDEAKQKNIQFLFDNEKDNLPIDADEEKLDKVIYNILSNAFKYTPKNGEINVSIRENSAHKNSSFSNQLSFGTVEDENFIEIQVVDNGVGIDSDDLPNIFDRFEQGKNNITSKYSTGIGLHLCKEYTLMHRGAIILQSTPGEGTSFSLQIPIKQTAQTVLSQNQAKVENINPWQYQDKSQLKTKVYDGKIKLLLVEDNNELRKYMESFLCEYYSIVAVENGEEGLRVLKTQNIQLIISDVMMPVMDGFEFCQIVKSQIETSHIPVILLTALSSAENTATGLDRGADAYISKPFDENVLLSQIDNLIEQRIKLQENYIQKFISKQPVEIGSLDNYFFNKVNSVIEKNLEDESFSVEKLAAEMGFSRSQLYRKFKQVSTYSSSEYIMMVRLRKATTLLATKKYSIDDVAFKTGFNSHSYFTKSFKKHFNKSPKEYLNEL